MTIGSDFLVELKQRDRGHSHFKYEQCQQLREIDSLEELRTFLCDHGYRHASLEGDVPSIARSLAKTESAKRSRWDWLWTLEQAKNLVVVAILAVPVFLPALCVNWLLGKRFRLQRTRENCIAYVVLVALFVAYEFLVAARFGTDLVSLRARCLAGLGAAVIAGTGFATLLRSPAWLAVALAVVVELEVLILAVAGVTHLFGS